RSCLLCLILLIVPAFGQSKVAVVNFQRALLDTAEIKKASADLEAKYKPRQAELEKIRQEIQDLQQKLQSLAGKLTPQAESEMNFQLQRKQRDFQRLSEDLQSDVDEERNAILTKAGQRMREIINKLAEEKGADVIIDASNTLYFKPALDLTQEATAAYDKAYPVK
ncbi:MAG: OmpH family outer membrane protein, partial [Bryobacteraceae bacterium]